MLVNLRLFRKKVLHYKTDFRRFLTKIEKDPPVQLQQIMQRLDKEVWLEIDCLSCGNCCKKMTPTFSEADVKRIAAHFKMTPDAFKKKWLYVDKTNDWLNKKMPCQFLNKADNKCSIYAIRPGDCAGFPHLAKKNTLDYIHVHKQNIQYCPATFKMVEKMKAMLHTKATLTKNSIA